MLFAIILAEILTPLKSMGVLQLVSARARFHSQRVEVTTAARRGS